VAPLLAGLFNLGLHSRPSQQSALLPQGPWTVLQQCLLLPHSMGVQPSSQQSALLAHEAVPPSPHFSGAMQHSGACPS
jgi:hypothetical protein